MMKRKKQVNETARLIENGKNKWVRSEKRIFLVDCHKIKNLPAPAN